MRFHFSSIKRVEQNVLKTVGHVKIKNKKEKNRQQRRSRIKQNRKRQKNKREINAFNVKGGKFCASHADLRGNAMPPTTMSVPL